MKHLWKIILFALVVNGSFCDELFVASDYYTIGSDKKIVRFLNNQYDNSKSYTYVLSLCEDDNIGIDMAYRSGHIYIAAYYKNPDHSIYEHSDELFRQFSHRIKFVEPIASYKTIIDERESIDAIEEINNSFEDFFHDHGSDPRDFRRGNYIRDKIAISQTSNYYFLFEITGRMFYYNTDITATHLLSEIEIQFPYNNEIKTFIYNSPEDIHLIKKMFSIAWENGIQ
jgi:hypothetical protein